MFFTGGNCQENFKTTVLRNPGVKERVLPICSVGQIEITSTLNFYHVPGAGLST